VNDTVQVLERTSKLVVAWHLGKRDRVNTEDFVSKIRWATAPGWFDVSTDGFEPYKTAIDAGLYDRANHSQVVKVFSTTTQVVPESYKPAKFVSVQKDATSGNPDLDRAGTSHVERKNGTLRQWCKRLTRLTYAFSKSGRTFRPHSHCTWHTTIFAGSTARCVSRPQWKRGSPITSGPRGNSWRRRES